MNQIYLKLLNRLYFNSKQTKESNQGFVLPTLIGLGLIMTLVGLTLVGRSSTDQQTATSQKQASQAQAVAETGVTEVMQMLNKIRAIADHDISNDVIYNGNNNGTDNDEVDTDDWETEYKAVAATCADSYSNSKVKKFVDSAKNDSWITINDGKDRFRIRNYDYVADDTSNINSEGQGILTIEGQANFNQNTSTNVIETTIPVRPNFNGFPGFAGEEGNFSNNNVESNVVLKKCSLDSDDTNVEDIRANPFFKYPELPTWPQYSTEPTGILINGDGTIDNAMFGDDTDYDGNGSTITLPNDYPGYEDTNGKHHYIVDNTTWNGNRDVKINPDEEVTIYLRTNVNKSGNTNILHNCDNRSNPDSYTKPQCRQSFQIYGNNDENKYNGNTVTEFCLSGNSEVDAFIYAPDADVGVNGGGNNEGNFEGTVWAKKWIASGGGSCSSNSGSGTLIEQTINDFPGLPIEAPRRIQPPSNWERKSKNQ